MPPLLAATTATATAAAVRLFPCANAGAAAVSNVMQIEILANDWDGYRLLDSGNRRKLELFGNVRIVRSEPKAWWRPALPEAEWRKAVAVHEDEGREGRWRFHGAKPADWELPFEMPANAPGAAPAKLRFQLRFTDNSKQIGLFPEQSPHWRHLAASLPAAPAPAPAPAPAATTASSSSPGPASSPASPPPRLLNLFGYTGAASLIAAAAGWHVTHVDASKPAVAWARRNAELSGLAAAPVRWLVEDAVKFVQREVRRGAAYDAILLDPPVFGRGPGGEFWKIERDLPLLLDQCRALLSARASLVLLTVYTIDASSILCHNLLRQMTDGLGGEIRIGELAHRDEAGNRLLPLSLWGRWSRPPPA